MQVGNPCVTTILSSGDSIKYFDSQLTKINATDVKRMAAAEGARTLAIPAGKRSLRRRGPKNDR